MASTGGSFLEAGQWLRGYEKWMMDLAANRGFAEELLERVLANHLANARLILEAVGDYIQVIEMDDDLGAQNGPQISPRTYYELIQPRQKALWSSIHAQKPHVSIFLHSCGGIYDLIPGLIDAGLDILNPVQISARGMQPERLKNEFGGSLCFWGGGCDTQHVLPFGTPQEVYAHTCQNVEIFKPGGGFVFSQVHNIQANVPPENILAMFAAAHDAGVY
jgi:uroporphyrinogen decarboxylase